MTQFGPDPWFPVYRTSPGGLFPFPAPQWLTYDLREVGGRSTALWTEIESVARECSVPGWDGYGALPVQPSTVERTRSLLMRMPTGLPEPEIGAEPDGAITLEWHGRSSRALSVSVASDGPLHYAAIIGSSKCWGTEEFHLSFPERLRRLVAEVETQ
ncbi:hypothetical protein HZA57_07530 [Candidatus Poribacteria bacterium]|nr:hypothetical protein [Candidatus Poribacteria bacterium]